MAIKVAQVCHRYYPYIGGLVKHVESISERLVQQGIDVEILTIDPSGKLPAEEQRNGLSIKRFKSWLPNSPYVFSPSLSRYIKANHSRYSIIHAHNYQSLIALQAMLSKKNCRFILSPHYHNASDSLFRNLIRIPYGFLWSRFIYKADKIINVSKTEQVMFNKKFSIPDRKSIVIPNGVNEEAIRSAKAYINTNKVILYVGRLVQYKNVHHIIKAMPYLDNNHILCIIGDGSYKYYLQGLCKKLHLDSRVQIMTGLSDEEIYRWYKTCSVFVTLSKLEAFGITVLEAAAAGKPIIASAIPAFQELAEEIQGMRIVEISSINPKMLANIISQSAMNPDYHNNLKEYSWRNISERVGKVYHQVLNESSDYLIPENNNTLT